MRFGIWGLFVLGFLVGCSGGEKPTPSTGTASTTAAPSAETASSGEKPTSPVSTTTPSEPETPAAPEPPFVAPALAELDAQAQWEPQLVADPLELLKAQLTKEKPQATVAEALKLNNDSPANNDKILSVLGRLPENDAEVDWDATWNRHMRADIKSMNPLLASSVYEQEVMGFVGLSLFGADWNLVPFADSQIVKTWESSKDRMYDKVVLRDDLTWSDGKPITARDVEFSYHTIMDTRIPIPAVRSGTDLLRSVKAYDDHTLVFFHKEALATNIWNILFPIIPKHIFEKTIPEDFTLVNSAAHSELDRKPICGGPYDVSKREISQEIVLERRESWYMYNGKQVRPKPFFKTIRLKIVEDPNTALLALKKGDIDELLLTAEDWKTKTSGNDFYEKNTKATGVEFTYFHYLWNLKTPYFSDVRVRRALAYTVDYNELHQTLNYGLYQPCNGPFNPAAWYSAKPGPQPMQQDLEQAVKLLEEAGWTDSDGDGVLDKTIDGNLVPFEFSILCPNIPDRIKYCTLLKEGLAQIGITCNIRPLEFTALLDKLQKHDFQAAYGGWGAGADPQMSDNVWTKGEMRNYGFYDNPEVNELYKQTRKEFDREKRAKLFAQIHQKIWDDQPSCFLYFRNAFYAFGKELRGYRFSPRGPYSYTPGWASVWKPKK